MHNFAPTFNDQFGPKPLDMGRSRSPIEPYLPPLHTRVVETTPEPTRFLEVPKAPEIGIPIPSRSIDPQSTDPWDQGYMLGGQIPKPLDLWEVGHSLGR